VIYIKGEREKKVPFVGSGASKRQSQTNDETEDGEKDARHIDWAVLVTLFFLFEDPGIKNMSLRGCTMIEMQLMAVDQPPTKTRGRIKRGKILPCMRKKVGHFVCLLRSRGPT
jgi:hypothetical protein